MQQEAKKIHDLKTWPDIFQAMKLGEKKAEFRKNDRNFKLGECLNLREWDNEKEEYTGETLLVRISHIVYGGQFGIPPDENSYYGHIDGIGEFVHETELEEVNDGSIHT